ncbi:MAG: hypothetical protein A3F68_02600 [Acidobacteria bacterium RIFCSPLOWO2_12_FULL_54_10]|nr:MAG: hypothetical protein A3F68_02600 [Acidobacteria bacterium RIFCSPLOWO2_12_FULL_54_10]
MLLALLAIIPSLRAQTPGAFVSDYSQGQEAFPRFYKPYISQPVAPPDLSNSARISQLIRDGKLQLSLRDLLAIVLENNLDVDSARYEVLMADTDILRAKSGQAPRGTANIRVPSGLFAGAIGAGVSGTGGGGGAGAGGGGSSITGSARQISVGARGSYDPSLRVNFSMDNSTSPLNSIRVAGIPVVTTHTTAMQLSYSQAFTSGSSFSLSFTNQRQSSTQRSLLFNPDLSSRYNFSIHQNLLAGFGFSVNRRFLRVAERNRQLARDVFHQQAIQALSQAQNLYWDLVAARDRVRAAEQGLTVAEQLLRDNRKRAELGALAPLDVVAAEAEVAARQRDLVIEQTNSQLAELRLKNAISRQVDDAIGNAAIETTEALPDPQASEMPALDEAITQALRNRPEMVLSEGRVLNQEIAVEFTKDRLRPTLGIFGVLAGAGRSGALPTSVRQLGGFDFPEYAFGFSLSVPVFNRAAQADHTRSRLDLRQAETAVQQTRNQIQTEVRTAVIGLLQTRAQVASADKAVDKTRQTLDAEQKRLDAGVSTSYSVIQIQRDLITAEAAAVEARAAFARARVEYDRATGATLTNNQLSLDSALTGR